MRLVRVAAGGKIIAPAAESLTLEWNDRGEAEWERLLAACGRSSLEQSWAYGEAVAAVRGRSTRRLVANWQGRPLALAQVFELRRRLPLTLVQLVRGPLWLRPPSADQQRALYRAIKRHYSLRRRALLLWMPELEDGPAGEALMRAIGTRRMVTGLASAWLDLTAPAERLRANLHGKWRNALRAAERAGLEIGTGLGEGRLDWLLEEHDRYRRKARFVGPPGAFLRACAEAAPSASHLFCAYRAQQPIAAVLLLGHGACATYAAGYTSDAGRSRQAHNLLLWHAMLALKDQGLAWLDLGGINAAAPGVARFKLGMGGEFYLLSGTYL